jgi:hypothetical protein
MEERDPIADLRKVEQWRRDGVEKEKRELIFQMEICERPDWDRRRSKEVANALYTIVDEEGAKIDKLWAEGKLTTREWRVEMALQLSRFQLAGELVEWSGHEFMRNGFPILELKKYLVTTEKIDSTMEECGLVDWARRQLGEGPFSHPSWC